jgi:hypothetical protein
VLVLLITGIYDVPVQMASDGMMMGKGVQVVLRL